MAMAAMARRRVAFCRPSFVVPGTGLVMYFVLTQANGGHAWDTGGNWWYHKVSRRACACISTALH